MTSIIRCSAFRVFFYFIPYFRVKYQNGMKNLGMKTLKLKCLLLDCCACAQPAPWPWLQPCWKGWWGSTTTTTTSPWWHQLGKNVAGSKAGEGPVMFCQRSTQPALVLFCCSSSHPVFMIFLQLLPPPSHPYTQHRDMRSDDHTGSIWKQKAVQIEDGHWMVVCGQRMSKSNELLSKPYLYGVLPTAHSVLACVHEGPSKELFYKPPNSIIHQCMNTLVVLRSEAFLTQRRFLFNALARMCKVKC